MLYYINMTADDINRLIGRAATDQSFASRLIKPESRFDALNDFQQGKEEGVVHPEGEPRRGNLTLWEMNELLKIKAENIEAFARGAQDIIETMRREKK